jgi:hypothetical protein
MATEIRLKTSDISKEIKPEPKKLVEIGKVIAFIECDKKVHEFTT